jgi:hypothetical protein
MTNQNTNFHKTLIRILRSELYIPGYCENPDADEPIWNIRIFEEEGSPSIYAFSSMAKMKFFFYKRSALVSLKYMKIRSPDHYEAISGMEKYLVLNPGTSSSQRLSSDELLEIMKQERNLITPPIPSPIVQQSP